MPDLKEELRQLADDAARQAQPWPVADVIREGDRRHRQRITRRRQSTRAPRLPAPARPGRRWPGWVAPLAAAAAVIAVVTVVTTVSGVIHDAGPAGGRPAASIVYAVFQPPFVHPGKTSRGVIIPIRTAGSTPGRPIRLPATAGGGMGDVEITPDGRTIYTGTGGTSGAVVPISTASGRPGKPIHVPGLLGGPGQIMIDPDGKTAYVMSDGTVTPVNTATHTPGKPIRLPGRGDSAGITPNGKTLYAGTWNGTSGAVVPISTATNKPGQPIPVRFRNNGPAGVIAPLTCAAAIEAPSGNRRGLGRAHRVPRPHGGKRAPHTCQHSAGPARRPGARRPARPAAGIVGS